MEPDNILLIGVKGAVLAFRRDNGAHLWATKLKSNAFVTVASDEDRVYAHTAGELFCLDLISGLQLWHDGLKGYGYDLASLALPGVTPTSPLVEKMRQQQAAADSAAHSSTTT